MCRTTLYWEIAAHPSPFFNGEWRWQPTLIIQRKNSVARSREIPEMKTQSDQVNSVLIKARAPAALREAMVRAAKKEFATQSEWMRRAILQKLRAEGVEPLPAA